MSKDLTGRVWGELNEEERASCGAGTVLSLVGREDVTRSEDGWPLIVQYSAGWVHLLGDDYSLSDERVVKAYVPQSERYIQQLHGVPLIVDDRVIGDE